LRNRFLLPLAHGGTPATRHSKWWTVMLGLKPSGDKDWSQN
jgi:hypothetical protein